MTIKDEILKFFDFFFINDDCRLKFEEYRGNSVIEILKNINKNPISHSLLNEILGHLQISTISRGFFEYYWLKNPEKHTYPIDKLKYYQKINNLSKIESLEQLRNGLYRFFVDSLLFFGNIKRAFNFLRNFDYHEIENVFVNNRINTEELRARGQSFPLNPITSDDTYLISEMACKVFGNGHDDDIQALTDFLYQKYISLKELGFKKITKIDLFQEIPEEKRLKKIKQKEDTNFQSNLLEFALTDFDYDETDELDVEKIKKKVATIANKYVNARNNALNNTSVYLSMARDLDVYIATSMRTKDQFKKINALCENVFEKNETMKDLNIRYFNPTICAAENHEDKGIVECFMVQCCKVLIFIVGESDSYGKVAETAMALSLGKPVIFYCEKENREKLFQKVHPLTRLINFSNGVVNGGMVISTEENLKKLLFRIFYNKMEYDLDIKESNRKDIKYYILKERLSETEIRLQTNDMHLSNAFWNYYSDKEVDF